MSRLIEVNVIFSQTSQRAGPQMAERNASTSDLTLIPEPAWQEAERRADLIRPLATRPFCSQEDAATAAQKLGVSTRHVYRLIRQCREGGGDLTSLIVAGPSGGRGQSRIPHRQDELVRSVIEEMYLTPQRLSAERIVQEVRRRAYKLELPPPSASTIRRRLAALPLSERSRRGDVVVPEAVKGSTPLARFPLDRVQMDHTPVDVILVDPFERQPIGRPWITVAVDVYSRCIAGFHVSLEAPSSTSVGLCLTHMAADKNAWLQGVGVEADWPIAGKPLLISVDNAKEFHSDAFERGCAQHDIAIDWRPIGQPKFGGVVERMIGTLMELVHSIPGTTFSNVMQRGKYDSDKAACLTLGELERWLTVAIAKFYHVRPHGGLDDDTPLRLYRAGVQALAASGKATPTPLNPHTYLMDFLPVVWRTLRREGVVIDHIHYFCDALKPWIERSETPERLLIRRDPRDLSRIYILDDRDGGYLEVPYRELSRPPVSLWEHRLARARLRQRRQTEWDERVLFAAIEEMREIESEAARTTRSMRRNRARRLSLRVVEGTARPSKTASQPWQPKVVEDGNPLEPFDVEEW
ncbi:Mu transposase C-terminal domain-containing protein [Kerstersia gyiorum]|uniref:Mu transposase C-terminal domain-containing protein n=1 Tax=Kerstersia gyiorum TaxID=206506 RepID=UPI0020A1499A|nr:Mu transposase C-terminal domain-containing protein [Kerstersia gyiorum]MCP1638276.1 putative transposase [Kerstersia gyiorum]MCP1672876.1 putative transposase [Kerstersia gyiorum]MCP1710790.1 putative transposase [Kerstersia gyiorum]